MAVCTLCRHVIVSDSITRCGTTRVAMSWLIMLWVQDNVVQNANWYAVHG